MRSDDEHRKNQVTVMRKRLSQPFVAAQYDRMRKLLLVNAISPLAFIMTFQFTRSFVVESMHVILKGMLLTQLKLTLDKVHKLQPWCIHKTTGATKILVKRLKWYKFPKGHNQPYRVLDRFKRLKCAELLDFLRVCTANVFYGLISGHKFDTFALSVTDRFAGMTDTTPMEYSCDLKGGNQSIDKARIIDRIPALDFQMGLL